MISAPMIIMTTIMAITAGRKYCSTIDGGDSVGAGVGSGASSTANAVVACEGQ